jgi:hypothetical protein
MCRVEAASPKTTETLNKYIDLQCYDACAPLLAAGVKFCWDCPLPPCWNEDGTNISNKTKHSWVLKAKLLGLL